VTGIWSFVYGITSRHPARHFSQKIPAVTEPWPEPLALRYSDFATFALAITEPRNSSAR
jgi:cation transport regulator ChaC